MKQDEILTEYVNDLRKQNEDLEKRLSKKSRSILGISEMWIAFWNVVGNIWKDFWTAITSMHKVFWDRDANVFGIVIISVLLTLIGSFTYHNVKKLEQPTKLTNTYYLRSGHTGYSSDKECFFVMQEKTNGESISVTPCIKNNDEALEFLEKMRSTNK